MSPASAPEPSGSTDGRLAGRGEAGDVAVQHPEPGEQVVAEVDRLGALQMGVARHAPVAVRLGQGADPLEDVAEQADRVAGGIGDEHRQVGRDLIVARAAGVDLAADPAGDLGQPPLDRHVDVLVGVLEGEALPLELGGDLVEAVAQLLELGVVEDAGGVQGAGVGARLAHVVGGQPPVEVERGVERPEDGIRLRFSKRVHRRQSLAAPGPNEACGRGCCAALAAMLF